jgi:hypothetical protein
MRHRDVEYRDVGAVHLREAQRFAAVGRDGDDVEPCALENGPEALADDDVIVGEQQGQRHDWTLKGIIAITFVPRPGAEWIKNCPPNAWT